MESQCTFLFSEGSIDDRMLLGNKGAGLAEMSQLGLPVPPGFIVSTDACKVYQREGRLPEAVWQEVRERVRYLEVVTGRRFGGPDPLLVSVRSGAAISMPGMMDTVLNLGLNRKTVEGLAQATSDRRFAFDCHRRFIQMFATVVLQEEGDAFEAMIAQSMAAHGVSQDTELDEAALASLIEAFEAHLGERGRRVPDQPEEQLLLAIEAVFRSWDNPRAHAYREIHQVPEDLGTAVVVQSMVFGNRGQGSATGVLFTRNPNTGEKAVYGEYLQGAQGEDVVSGVRTPRPIAQMQEDFPTAYRDLVRSAAILENHFRAMQEMEFTVEQGEFHILQTRNGKHSVLAGVRMAYDMVQEGLIAKREAVMRIDPESVPHLLHPRLDPGASVTVVALGLPASPGAVSGAVVFNAEEAEERGRAGEAIILVRPETNPDDIRGIYYARGVLTTRGGTTSHAAVVARGLGKPAITGCEALRIDLEAEALVGAGVTVRKNDRMTIDGSTGRVILGEAPTIASSLPDALGSILDWADDYKRLGVKANADTPTDAQQALDLGADGIGLCRTEHMFMGPERLPVMRRMIIAETEAERKEHLAQLEEMQEEDFYRIVGIMHDRTVTIRLLDPPMHEFLPKVPDIERSLAQAREAGDDESMQELTRTLHRAEALREFNPMLGLRGVRLAVLYPEIYEMQARAIFRATGRLIREGINARVQIMIPLVGMVSELEAMEQLIRSVHQAVEAELATAIPYQFGTMIEIPRAAVIAGALAERSEFFSFGTNDLTQTIYGFSRDDAEGKFLSAYQEQTLLTANPFMRVDEEGVGALIHMGVERGRKVRPAIELGVCGEHAGDPASVHFFHRADLDYVSCSPFRVPVARLAAAQAALQDRHGSSIE